MLSSVHRMSRQGLSWQPPQALSRTEISPPALGTGAAMREDWKRQGDTAPSQGQIPWPIAWLSPLTCCVHEAPAAQPCWSSPHILKEKDATGIPNVYKMTAALPWRQTSVSDSSCRTKYSTRQSEEISSPNSQQPSSTNTEAQIQSLLTSEELLTYFKLFNYLNYLHDYRFNIHVNLSWQCILKRAKQRAFKPWSSKPCLFPDSAVLDVIDGVTIIKMTNWLKNKQKKPPQRPKPNNPKQNQNQLQHRTTWFCQIRTLILCHDPKEQVNKPNELLYQPFTLFPTLPAPLSANRYCTLHRPLRIAQRTPLCLWQGDSGGHVRDPQISPNY